MGLANFTLEGRVAIVTGGSRGIGRAIAVAMAEAGADIVLAARKAGDLNSAASAVEGAGRKVLAVETNVRDMAALQNLVDRTREHFGRIDILVNNAATNPVFGPIANIDERAWDTTMNTNVKSMFFLSKLVREAMIAGGHGGSIINVSSTGGVRPGGGLGAYSVSKAAVIMLTRVCASEWGRDGIRVNCIAPGLIRTEFSRALWDNEERLERTTSTMPAGRIGESDDLAGAAVYLASDASAYVTAQTIVVDGGQTGA